MGRLSKGPTGSLSGHAFVTARVVNISNNKKRKTKVDKWTDDNQYGDFQLSANYAINGENRLLSG
jgi:hypothetical protein